MVLTEEKGKMLADYLMEDQERANRLLSMSPEEAVKELNAAGYSFTAEELVEFGDVLSVAVNQGELSEDDLENVAGGLGVVATYCVACGIAFVCGYAVKRLEKW